MKALLEAGFDVTVLARKESQLPAGASLKVVDFGSTQAIAEALAGNDAFVDATNVHDDTPIRIMDAAAQVGIKRYIPSDYSLDPSNPKLNALPVFYPKAMRDKYLEEKCKATGMTWSIVCNGGFLDWNLMTGFMDIDVPNKRSRLWEGGVNVIPWTTLGDTAKAIVGILQHPDETANRPVFVHTVNKSTRQLTDLAQEAIGSDGWDVSTVDAVEAYEAAVADFKAGKISLATFASMIRYANAFPDMSKPWAKPDNELFGIKGMSDDEVKTMIRGIAAG